ncbi:ribosomal protein S18 acetylase RimI-like enzyme [Kribbella amoyensis]|uniref:Ribosomal protein S18 acetylase RimI-like enzyme n=1 Tax=Kribbella amoyensis TaxID=996641 RepID=A0A561C031_9ACTN|nr:GNAT family N-acetyltransferase [Kribbella amoyensis]TWD84513.1 ribosomal protein S18 acetylase RimI-like enzyme [Kribbella amoyensis]
MTDRNLAAEVKTRTALDEDAPRLIEAYDWLFAAPGSKPEDWDSRTAGERLAKVFASQRSDVLVAEVDQELLGFCSIYLDIESVRFGQRCWVEDLAVHPAHRSVGIGAVLLGQAQRWAREHGGIHLELDSALARTDAHRFYDRHQPASRSMCFSWQLER